MGPGQFIYHKIIDTYLPINYKNLKKIRIKKINKIIVFYLLTKNKPIYSKLKHSDKIYNSDNFRILFVLFILDTIKWLTHIYLFILDTC